MSESPFLFSLLTSGLVYQVSASNTVLNKQYCCDWDFDSENHVKKRELRIIDRK